MKLNYLFFVLVMLCLLLSCGSTSNVFDESIPLERSAILNIAPTIEIKSYNGIPVKLKVSGIGYTGYTIPAGITTFEYDVDTGRTFGNFRFFGNNFSLEFNFEGGKGYYIVFGFVDEEGNLKRTNLGNTSFALFIFEKKDFENKNFENPLLMQRFK